jgi:hypothetical protein
MKEFQKEIFLHYVTEKEVKVVEGFLQHLGFETHCDRISKKNVGIYILVPESEKTCDIYFRLIGRILGNITGGTSNEACAEIKDIAKEE